MNYFQKIKSAFISFYQRQSGVAVIVIGLLFSSSPLFAQQADGTMSKGEMPPVQDQQQQAFQQVRDEYVAAQQRLEQIQQDTIEAHPELQKQEQAFNELLVKEMKNKGHSPQQQQAEIEKIQGQLQNTKMADTDRETLMNQFQEKIMAYRKAQVEAMQNQDVQKAQNELLDAIVTAMKEHDPQTEQLISQMTQKRQQLMKMHGANGH